MLCNMKDPLIDPEPEARSTRSNSRNDALLAAAAELFATQGFRSTSMRDIAKAVGMLPGSIYYHFPSKDDLLLAIYEAGVDQITATFEAAIESVDDPWERLEEGMAALVRAVTDDSSFTSVIFKVEPDEVPKYQVELIAFRDRFEALFRDLVDELPLQSWVDPHLLRLMLLGAANHAQLWYSASGPHTANEIGQHIARMAKQTVAE